MPGKTTAKDVAKSAARLVESTPAVAIGRGVAKVGERVINTVRPGVRDKVRGAVRRVGEYVRGAASTARQKARIAAHGARQAANRRARGR